MKTDGRLKAEPDHVRLKPAAHTTHGWWHIQTRSGNPDYRTTECGVQLPTGFTETGEPGPGDRTCPRCRARHQERQFTRKAAQENRQTADPGVSARTDRQETLF